jgi:hypothetical protein
VETAAITDGPFAETKERLAGFYMLIRWNRQPRVQSKFLPCDDQVCGVQRWLLAEAVV